MPQPLAGPGLGLPAPRFLYPVALFNAPLTAGSFVQSLATGDALVVPAGTWIGSWPAGCMLQWYDTACTGQWINMNAVYPIGVGSDAAGVGAGANATGFGAYFKSDGFSYRIANLTGVAWAARVTAAGSGYAQATTTVTAGTGNSSWMPIIGGALGSFTVTAGGSGYTMPPLVFIPMPPAPGVPAVATATLTGSAVSSIAVVAGMAGAGYLTAPQVIIQPNPNDPAYLSGAITANATATVALTGAGTLTAVLLQNFGQSLASAPTLTVSGAGSSATAVTVPAALVAQAAATIILQPAP